MANQDIQTKNIILKDKEKAFSELKSGEEDVFQVTRKNEDLQLRIRNLDSITKTRDDELMNAKLTIQDMTAELDSHEKQKKALQLEIDRLQKEIERFENEVSDLNYRLQEANDQCSQLAQNQQSGLKLQLQQENHFEQILDEREKSENLLIQQMQQQFEAKETKLN